MKRKTWLLLMVLPVLLLAGCAKEEQSYETISDTLTPTATDREEYSIVVALPSDVTEETFETQSAQHVYVQQDGDYEVITDVMTDTGVEEALRSLSGQDSETLTVLKTERFGMPEYRTTWYSMSDEGGYVNRASVIFDGATCYCVSFSVREELAGELTDQMEDVFSSIGLFVQEF